MLPAYHRRRSALATGERVIVPVRSTAWRCSTGESHWVVTGPNPGWMAARRGVAEQFAAFEVKLTASSTPAAQRACLS